VSDRTSGRREVALALGSYAVYLGVRAAVYRTGGRARARRNGERVLAVEERFRFAIERSVQQRFDAYPRLQQVLAAGYAGLNMTVSVGHVIWLWYRADPGFARERRAVLAVFLGALPVHLFLPTEPPRMLEGFTDTLAEGGWNLDSPFVQRFYNPITALPSYHVAFAVVTAAALTERVRPGLPRLAARGYAPVVAFVVVSTANHYVLDVLAGAALGAASWRWSR
jgi:membrane-associated phospholipid phosphatase